MLLAAIESQNFPCENCIKRPRISINYRTSTQPIKIYSTLRAIRLIAKYRNYDVMKQDQTVSLLIAKCFDDLTVASDAKNTLF